MCEFREALARELCEADCGHVTENELARCRELADVALAFAPIAEALRLKHDIDKLKLGHSTGDR